MIYLKVNVLQNGIGAVKFKEQHDKDAMVWDLLEIGLPDFVINEQNTGNNSEHFVQKIHFGDRILSLSGVLDKQCDQADVGIKGMEAFCPDQRWRVVGLGQSSIERRFFLVLIIKQPPG